MIGRRAFNEAALALALFSACKSKPGAALTVATTTSTRDSGLLDFLVPHFSAKTGINPKVVATGSGQALELGRRGNAEALLVHAPRAEERFVAEGRAASRRAVMYNDFVVVGPAGDSAGVRAAGPSVEKAFALIAAGAAPFVSRADGSGTEEKEKEIWARARIVAQGPWYRAAGTGMAEVLRMANEMRAYTLADRGTFLAQRRNLSLEIVCEKDVLLRNPYTVITVKPETDGARLFAEFLVSPEARALISSFGVETYGEPLFHVQTEP